MSQYLRFISISPILGILSYMLSYYSQIGDLPSLKEEFIPFLISAVFGLTAGFTTLGICKLLNKLIRWDRQHSLRFILQSLALFLVGCILIICYLELFDMMLEMHIT